MSCLASSLPWDIDSCQYRCVSIPLTVISPAETAACCAPLTTAPLSMEQAEQVAPLLKALADPVRLRLMSLVASHEGGQACICDLNEAFELSQPTISHHMKVLHEAGPVDRDKRGGGCTTASARRRWPAWPPCRLHGAIAGRPGDTGHDVGMGIAYTAMLA